MSAIYQIIPVICIPMFAFAIAIILYFVGTWNHDYYKKLNVPYVRPIPVFGNMAPLLFRRFSACEFLLHLYQELGGHEFGGFFSFCNPAFMLRDPELIRNVCIRDFDHFTDRNTLLREDMESIAGRVLPSLSGEKWRHMRSVITPAFTPSKIRDMYEDITECSQKFLDFLQQQKGQISNSALKIENVDGELQVEMRDMASRYCTDVFAATTLGYDCDSFTNPNNELYRMGQSISNVEGTRALVVLGHALSPKLMKFLRLPIVHKEAMDFFRRLTRDAMSSRGSGRQDVLQLLMQARDTSGIHAKDLDDDTIAAQMMVTFMAGLETVSTLLCFVTNLLAVHQDVQARLKQEVWSLASRTGGHVTLEDLHQLEYLEMIIAETLRLYPPIEVIDRKCVKSYTIPGSETCPEFTFREGEGLIIPVYALHHDPVYFENPGRFFPERFSPRNRDRIQPFTYLPFGTGPRNCIGMKFAMAIVKLTLFNLFLRFDLRVVDRTPVPIRLSKMCFNKRVDGGFWLGLRSTQISI